MSLPILYSFRRCPYAMRARLALLANGLSVELREVSLRAKPAAMVAVSPKATVPVFILPNCRVIDQSLDIMRWAYAQRGNVETLDASAEALIATNDTAFKHHLDRYKYAERYPEDAIEHRDAATAILEQLETWYAGQGVSIDGRPSFTDIAILPFVRQFVATDSAYFDQLALANLQHRLAAFVGSRLFAQAMVRLSPWQPSDRPSVFGAGHAHSGLAEEVGFEPTEGLHPRWFSRPVP